MRLTIHKGHCRPRWWLFLLWPFLSYDKRSIAREVLFTGNCSYDLPGDEDDMDVNKLFGLGYAWGKESARFGWNYNNVTGKIELFAYCHFNGKMDFTKICDLAIGFRYLLILNVHDISYSFSVMNLVTFKTVGSLNLSKQHRKKISYNQGLYFGGTQKAPHDITIEIKKP